MSSVSITSLSMQFRPVSWRTPFNGGPDYKTNGISSTSVAPAVHSTVISTGVPRSMVVKVDESTFRTASDEQQKSRSGWPLPAGSAEPGKLGAAAFRPLWTGRKCVPPTYRQQSRRENDSKFTRRHQYPVCCTRDFGPVAPYRYSTSFEPNLEIHRAPGVARLDPSEGRNRWKWVEISATALMTLAMYDLTQSNVSPGTARQDGMRTAVSNCLEGGPKARQPSLTITSTWIASYTDRSRKP